MMVLPVSMDLRAKQVLITVIPVKRRLFDALEIEGPRLMKKI